MEHSLHLINEILDELFAYGPFWIYIAIGVSSYIENIFPPFPGDFVTITGGALAAAGRLDVAWVFFVAYAGGIGSAMTVYYLGRRFGRSFFIGKNYKYFSANDIKNMEAWLNRRGTLLMLFNRFVVGARTVIMLAAGIGNYKAFRAFALISISFWLFNGLLLFSSHLFIVNFDTIAHYFHLYERIMWPVIIIIMVAIIVKKIHGMKKNGRKV